MLSSNTIAQSVSPMITTNSMQHLNGTQYGNRVSGNSSIMEMTAEDDSIVLAWRLPCVHAMWGKGLYGFSSVKSTADNVNISIWGNSVRLVYQNWWTLKIYMSVLFCLLTTILLSVIKCKLGEISITKAIFKNIHLQVMFVKLQPFCSGLNVLTHCGPMMPYGDIDLGQH